MLSVLRDVNKLLIKPDSSLRDVIKAIDEGGMQLALVINDEQKLLGTITDGDVRRGLLRGLTLESKAREVMATSFKSTLETDPPEVTKEIMKINNFSKLPVLSQGGYLNGVAFIGDLGLTEKKPNTVVIMAGGRGKRLMPFTEDCPKPMLPVGGKPMLQMIVENCREAGLTNFIFTVNYLKEKIMDYFGDGEKFGVKIEYVVEENPLGTAGALSLIDKLPNEPMLVMNGDVLTRVNYSSMLEFHETHNSDLTVCARIYSIKVPFGVVKVEEGQVFGIKEKPVFNHYVNAGVYVLNPQIIKDIPLNEFHDMTEMIERRIASGGKVCAFPVHEYWLDVGNPESFEKANGDWTEASF